MLLILITITTALAPLYVLRFNIGPLPATLLEILILATVVVWFFKRIFTKERGLKSAAPLLGAVSLLDTGTVLFLAAGVVSTIISPDKRSALGILKAYIIEPILFYIVIKDTIKTKKQWRWIFRGLMFSGFLVALLSVAQGIAYNFAPGIAQSITFAPHEAEQNRAHAVYNTANAVGLYLGPLLALAFAQVKKPFSNRAWFKDFGWILLTAVYLSAIVFTKSTGALVASAGVLFLLPLTRYNPKLLKTSIKIVFFVVILISLALPIVATYTNPAITPGAEERFTNNTTQLRLCLWEGTGRLILDKPLTGAGLSGFKELYASKYYTCDREPLEYPHNVVLNFWTELGFLGVAAFFALLWRLMSKKLPLVKAWKPYLPLVLGLVYMLVHGLVDVPYFKNDLSLQFWVLAGLIEAGTDALAGTSPATTI